MLSYEQVKRKASQFKSLVGMNVEEFELLHNYYELQWNGYIKHFTVSGTPRLRAHRIRKDGKLENSKDQLVFILHYLKSNGVQEHHAAAYQMNQPQANLWIHLLLVLLKKTFKAMGELPERRAGKLKALLQNMEQVFIDGTERDIQRPLDAQAQKAHYSGKKKHIK